MIKLTLHDRDFELEPLSLGGLDELDRKVKSYALAVATEAANQVQDRVLADRLLKAALSECMAYSSMSTKGKEVLRSISGVRMILECCAKPKDGESFQAFDYVKDHEDMQAVMVAFQAASDINPTKLEKAPRRKKKKG